MLYLDNFFNSPTLVEKVFNREIYYLGTVRSEQKNMAIMKKNKDMKRGDIYFQYTNDKVAVKWFDNRGVKMFCTCLEERNKVSTVTSRVKGKSATIPVSCPENIKDYNSGMRNVDLLDQKRATYKLNRKSSDGHYYLRSFFDRMDIPVVNSQSIGNNRLKHVFRREVLPASVPQHLPVLQATKGNVDTAILEGLKTKHTLIVIHVEFFELNLR